MRWYFVFVKGLREQVRDYWILIMIVVMTPLFIAIYFLMVDPGEIAYDVIILNRDQGVLHDKTRINMGDSLALFLGEMATGGELPGMHIVYGKERKHAMEMLRKGKADVLMVIPGNLSASLKDSGERLVRPAQLELVGDVTRVEYIVGAIWIEELVNAFVLGVTGVILPVSWKETTLGHSGERSMFELYVPGLLILSIIMIIFSASAAIVREPEARTLERLKISRLTSVEFLGGTSLVQIIIALVSLLFALLTALALGYTLIPGTLGFIILVALLTALSMISFSLIVAAMCRSIKEVAIIGTFPLFLLMFFTGAAFPISGGRLFTVGGFDVMLNHILSPTWAVNALNKVLVSGLDAGETAPELVAIVVLTLLYCIIGTWLFRLRHMKPG
ncbi:MAG: ABC transporter permease [Bacteroidota bacterium]